MFFAVGIALATLFLWGIQLLGIALRPAAALTLVAAALVYVGVALVACDSTAVVIELAGLALFSAFAWAGLRGHPSWLVVGWLAHPAWDFALHMMTRTCTPGVVWYAQLCLSFDLVVAAYLAHTMRGRLEK
jgi:hypothetical protein